MKNLIFVFIAATLLVLTSCSKENLDLPTPEKMESIAEQDLKTTAINTSEASITQLSDEPQARPVIIYLQVSEVSNVETATEYAVLFSGNYDFRNVELAPNQTLQFTDANGNISNLTFGVNDAVGGNGTLDINFAKGSNVLTGLTLVAAQEIVIEDFIMN